MRVYETSWSGNADDVWGTAKFICGDKELEFTMDNFKEYLSLCELIDNVSAKVEKRNQVAIFEYINSYNKNI